MNWIVSKEKTGIEKGLEDIKVGLMFLTKDSQGLIKQIFE